MRDSIIPTSESVIMLAVFAAIIWLLFWMMVSGLDRQHCEISGADYHSTSLLLNGYCDVSGVKVPAESVGRGK